MYSGFDKESGGTIGEILRGSEEVDFDELKDSVSAEEILVCHDDTGRNCVLTSKIDPLSGDLAWQQWKGDDEIEAKANVLRMSQMSSMLRDDDRNAVFEGAIRVLIQNFISKATKAPVVLDIGTGTGLLALMCMRYGAEHVLAAEMFETLASTAQDVFFANENGDNILLLNGKSTDIEADVLPILPDLIISELLDSALLGESCIPSHADAISRLLRHDEVSLDLIPLSQRVIPHSASVFATLVHCEEIYAMQHPPNWDPLFNPWRCDQSASCECMQPLLPIHWESIEKRCESTRKLSDPTPILQFEFCNGYVPTNDDHESCPNDYPFGEGSYCTDVLVTRSGVVHGVLLWWTAQLLCRELDPTQRFKYSTEPRQQNWQDHWQQTVFPLPFPISCREGDVVRVSAGHNSTRIWLVADKVQAPLSTNKRRKTSSGTVSIESDHFQGQQSLCMTKLDFPDRVELKSCMCGWHMLCSPDRLLMLNDQQRTDTWISALTRLIDFTSGLSSPNLSLTNGVGPIHIIMDVADGSLLSILAALQLKKSYQNSSRLKVVSRERKLFSRMFHGQLAEKNGLDDLLMHWNGESAEDIIAYFSEAESEKENIPEVEMELENDESGPSMYLSPEEGAIVALIGECFYYQMRSRPTWQALSFHYQRVAMNSLLHPEAIVMPCKAHIMAAAFELSHLHRSHGEVGRVRGFDHSPYDEAMAGWHKNSFPYKLGNYEKRILSKPICVATLNYQELLTSFSIKGAIPITATGSCHCVALWVDYQCFSDNEDLQIRTWQGDDFVPYEKLCVRFFRDEQIVRSGMHSVAYSCDFEVGDSDFNFNFSIKNH